MPVTFDEIAKPQALNSLLGNNRN